MLANEEINVLDKHYHSRIYGAQADRLDYVIHELKSVVFVSSTP